MHTVRVSDTVKDIVRRCVATSAAASETEFLEQAVRLYAEYLEDNEAELIAAAEEGLEAIRRGEYTAVATPADAAAFWDGVWTDARRIADQLRDRRSSTETGARPGS